MDGFDWHPAWGIEERKKKRMGGAYTAKEGIPIETDYPPLWDPQWYFPGPPFPPGYAPDYGINLAAQETMSADLPVDDIVTTLTDHDVYDTTLPSGTNTYQARFKDDQSRIQLRLVDTEFADELVTNWEDPDLILDVVEGDATRVVELIVGGSPFDPADFLTDTADITIVTTEEYCDEDCEFPDATGCIDDCSNALADTAEIYKGIWVVDDCGIIGSATYASPDDRADIEAAGALAATAMSDWSTSWTEYCDWGEVVNDLECQKDEIECAGDSTVEIDQQIQAAQASRASALGDANGYKAAAEGHQADCIALVEALDETGIQVWYHDYIKEVPLVDSGCAVLGPTCSSRNPLRCAVTWSVKSKNHVGDRCEGTYSVGAWVTEISGGYTVTGKPYILSVRNNGLLGVPQFACASSTCNDIPYWCNGDWAYNPCGNSTYKREMQLYLTYAEPTDEGEECC